LVFQTTGLLEEELFQLRHLSVIEEVELALLRGGDPLRSAMNNSGNDISLCYFAQPLQVFGRMKLSNLLNFVPFTADTRLTQVLTGANPYLAR
jgi:hypothetical protein